MFIIRISINQNVPLCILYLEFWEVLGRRDSYLNIALSNLGIFNSQNKIITLLLGSPNQRCWKVVFLAQLVTLPSLPAGDRQIVAAADGKQQPVETASPPFSLSFCGWAFLGQWAYLMVLVWRVCQWDCREHEGVSPILLSCVEEAVKAALAHKGEEVPLTAHGC